MAVRELFAEPNLAHLDACLRCLSLRLSEPQTAETRRELDEIERFAAAVERDADEHGWVLRLARLARLFRLTRFERDVLLLAAAADLDERLAVLIAQAQPSGFAWPAVGLAWRLFCAATSECVVSRDAFRADAALLRFGFLAPFDQTLPLPMQPLRIDRRIADELAGRTLPDARIVPFLLPAAAVRAGARDALAGRLAAALAGFLSEPERPSHLVISLSGATADECEAVARRAAALVELPLLAVRATNFPFALAPLFVRESVLLRAALFIGDIDREGTDAESWSGVLADAGPIIFVTGQMPNAAQRMLGTARRLALEVPRLERAERVRVWRAALVSIGIDDGAAAAKLGEHHGLDESEIGEAVRAAEAACWFAGTAPALPDVLQASRAAARHRMAELAQPLVSALRWDDLLLPAESLEKLRELEAHVAHAARVFDDLGFASRVSRGRGVSALFAGPSGTGKTMAAEVIAAALGRELYRVDLALVVSKYIGETEKNLRAIFAEAERARCVVLFDEADALFGKRTEVRDSHDRYANIEVSYLLQLLEETRDAVILLATNRRDALDDAFLRRFRFAVDFPMPSRQMRLAFWQRSFPPEVDTRGVRFEVLAERLAISGANIKNIALAATFLAARDGGVVTPAHVERATRRELEKLLRPAALREADIAAVSP